MELYNNDCFEQLKLFDKNSIDGIVTDPPAGIAFMGKVWDGDLGGRDKWVEWMQSIAEEVYRVLKPGSHCLVWSLPRTSHWTATAWENAGFDVRDKVIHIFGSGFPKSHNVRKSVDKIQGNEREEYIEEHWGRINRSYETGHHSQNHKNNIEGLEAIKKETRIVTKGTSEFEGYGTALKPAHEDWLLLRKPISENNIALNCLKYGTGAINIDACRVDFVNEDDKNTACSERPNAKNHKINRNVSFGFENNDSLEVRANPKGRFPANLIHDGSEEVLSVFPETSKAWGVATNSDNSINTSMFKMGGVNANRYDIGGTSASRFFYCAKARKAERNAGLEGLPTKTASEITGRKENSKGLLGSKEHRNSTNPFSNGGSVIPRSNHHPTVKPIKLMEYLVKLITPPNPNAVILDLFMGSGSTGVACANLGVEFIGIEYDKEYFDIAKARIENAVKKKSEQLF